MADDGEHKEYSKLDKLSSNRHLTESLVKADKEHGEGELSEQGEETGKAKDISRREKIIRSISLYSVFFLGIGLPLFGVGPCLLDLQLLTGSSTQEISYVFTARSVGALCGGCLEGLLVDRKCMWLTIAVTTVLGNFMYTLAPQFEELWTLVGLMGIHGLFYGVYSTTISLVLTQMWGKDHGPWMQGLHMIGTVGGVIAPLLAKPFLTDAVPIVKSIDHADVNTPLHNHTHVDVGDVHSVDVASNVKWYFVMVGCVGMLSSIGSFVVFCRGSRQVFYAPKTKKSKEKRQQELEEGKVPARGKNVKIVILCLTFTFYMILSVYGRGYPNYTMAFTVEYLGWSKLHGALLTSLYLGVYVIGRIIGIFIIARISPQILIAADLIISISATVPVILAVNKHPAIYWVCTLVYGLGNATIFASGFPWLGQYFKMSGNVGTMPLIGGFMGDILGPPLVGYLFEDVTPMGFVYCSTAGGCLCLILLGIMQLLANRYKKLNHPQTLSLEVKVPNDNLVVDDDKCKENSDKV